MIQYKDITESFRITDIDYIGRDLVRPECVLVNKRGDVFASDARGIISRISANGKQDYLGNIESPSSARFRPNGIALSPNGDLIFTNLGRDGGIWSVSSTGEIKPILTEINGKILGPVNFVLFDQAGDIWFSVLSTAEHDAPLSATRADGYIARVKDGEAEIMADGLISANEFRICETRKMLFVNETFAGRTTSFDMNSNGNLSNPNVFAEYETGTFPDGVTLDSEGCLWITSIISNRILRVDRDGKVHKLFENSKANRIAAAVEALKNNNLDRALIYSDDYSILRNPSSIAFGGDDLRTVYIGSLTNNKIAVFQSPVAGLPPVNWEW